MAEYIRAAVKYPMLNPANNSRYSEAQLPGALKTPGLSSLLTDETGLADPTVKLEDAQLVHTIAAAKRFGRKAAHDFNNIIAVIHGFATILQNRLQHDEANRGIAEQIEASAVEALKLTTWLSAFANNRPSELVSLDLNEVVTGAVVSIGNERPAAIDLQLELAPEPLLMLGDETQLEKMCQELWSNAIEAMPQGGEVRWQTTTEQLPLHSCLAPDSRNLLPFLRLRVTDTGVGMDQDTQRLLFQPFFSTKSGKERGLGLSTVYDIVRAHEGFIEVASDTGSGTRVDIYFPAELPDVSHIPQSAKPNPQRKPSKLLVVDDEEMILDMVGQMLKVLGCDVIGVASGEAALDAYQQLNGEISAVILDMTLPGMNGLETFNKLKELDQGVKVILSTGDPHQRAVHDAVALGVFGVLSKPFLSNHLIDVVKQALS